MVFLAVYKHIVSYFYYSSSVDEYLTCVQRLMIEFIEIKGI